MKGFFVRGGLLFYNTVPDRGSVIFFANNFERIDSEAAERVCSSYGGREAKYFEAVK